MPVAVGLLFAALFVHRRRTVVSPMIPPAPFRGHGFGPDPVSSRSPCSGSPGLRGRQPPAVAERLPKRAGNALATAARKVFTSGMHAAAFAGAVVPAGAAVPVSVTLRQKRGRVREAATA
ncbi:hypothetical protein GCM10027162_25990 [Streptomyces incanus]